MCFLKWKGLGKLFLFIFEDFQLWQKKILAHYFLSSASSKETYISFPSSLSFSGQALKTTEFSNNTK